MKNYQKILLAVELEEKCDEQVVKKAIEIAKVSNATITMLHVVEHFSSYGAAYGIAARTDVEQELINNAKQAMLSLGERFGISPAQQIVKLGNSNAVILEEAKHLLTDLIVLGSHGRHGIRLLFGSTANGVLHGAKCDVWVVRIRENH